MENLIIIKTIDQLPKLIDYINSNEFIAFDTETTGVTKGSKIIGFSVSASPDIAYYVILSHWDVSTNQLIDLETARAAKEVIAHLANKNLIMHNGVFDCWMVENNYNIKLIDYLHTDTMIAGHLLDENRHNGLKELGVSIFGEDARAEQIAMKESVHKNGGQLTKDNYELYKADSDLIGRYGAKDTILTIKLFYLFVEQLYEQGLNTFFYEESMPLLKGPTYDLNTVGLQVDPEALQTLKGSLEADCMQARAFIEREIAPTVAKEYPGTSKAKTFNIGSSKQLAWLLFIKLENEFATLTKEGRNVCKALDLKLPYSLVQKRAFLQSVKENKGNVYEEGKYNPKTKKIGRPKKVGDVWNYLAADKMTLKKYSNKYKWVEKFLEYNKNLKLLTTYVTGIQERMTYNVIRPSFLQHGTTSGRYSSKNPNFQNLPRDDKRVKKCIVARPGKLFIGADYSQLEPRVFASFSEDKRLLACFKTETIFTL
jgi:DNA polymerase I-like protein with 3'-5' exonuclease and polymerase domains